MRHKAIAHRMQNGVYAREFRVARFGEGHLNAVPADAGFFGDRANSLGDSS